MQGRVYDGRRSIYVAVAEGKGRGVFAAKVFDAGEIIEEAPTWGFDRVAGSAIDRTGAFEYYFIRNDMKRDEDPMHGYFAFGFISIVNHSSRPNAEIRWTERDTGAWISIVAVRTIAQDEEITHHYTNADSYVGVRALIG